jgi:hypothetical protein
MTTVVDNPISIVVTDGENFIVSMGNTGLQGPAGGGGGGGVTDGDKGDIIVTGGGTVWSLDPTAASLVNKQPLTTVLTNTTASYTVAEQAKLAAIAAGATANSSDATLLARANHTGTQAAATITGLAAVATSGSAADLSAGILPAARFDDTAHGSRAGGTLHAAVVAAGASGFMSGADKTKLDGIAAGAQVNVGTDLSYTAASRLLASSTGADVTLPLLTSTDAGLAPASGGGTTNFLRADGTWAAPAGGGSPVTVQDEGSNITTALGTLNFVGAGVTVTGGATATVTIPGGGGISDGDKGDVTVSGGGAVWTIDAGVVTLAKMADVATATLIGRTTAGTGVPEALTPTQGRAVLGLGTLATQSGTFSGTSSGTNTGDETAAGILAKLITVDGAGSGLDADLLDGLSSAAFATAAQGALAATAVQPAALASYQPLDSDLTTIAGLTATTDNFIQSKAGAWASRTVAQVKTDLGLTGTNSGDQTSIVGITGTKAQFDTALTDGNFVFVGDAPTTHTHVAADVTDFASAVAATAAVTANTAKVTNATHTGDVTGATALTLATVNANVGSWGIAGSVAQFTVNAKGLITAAANVAISIASTAISDSTAAGRAFLTAATVAAQTALLDVFTSGAKGLAPASGGGTTNFLRADGTWAAPAGGGSPVTVQDEGSNITTTLGTLNFVGAGVTVTGGATATVTIAGGGGAYVSPLWSQLA